jgi:hypothetical protein
MQQLHAAQGIFDQNHRYESLVRSLLNESAYYGQKGDSGRAAELCDRASQVASEVGFILPAAAKH